MKKISNLNILIIVSLLLLILFPLNFTFTSLNIGIFFILNFGAYFLLWLIPAIIIYKKGLKKKYYVLTIIISIIGMLVIGYFGEQYGIKKQRENIEKIRLMNEKIDNNSK